MSLTYFNHNFPLTLHHRHHDDDHPCRRRLSLAAYTHTHSLNVKLIGADGDTMAYRVANFGLHWRRKKKNPLPFLFRRRKAIAERWLCVLNSYSYSHSVVYMRQVLFLRAFLPLHSIFSTAMPPLPPAPSKTQNHNHVYADDGFNKWLSKTYRAQTPNKFYH